MKYLAILFNILFINSLHAQDHFQIKTSYGISVEGIWTGIYPMADYGNPFNWAVRTPLRTEKNRLFLQFNPGWVSRGTVTRGYQAQPVTKFEARYQLEYIEVPLHFGYHFLTKNNIKIYAFAGGGVSYSMYGNYQRQINGEVIEYYDFPENKAPFAWASLSSHQFIIRYHSLRRWEWSIHGGLGTEFKLKNQRCFAEAHYNRALSSTFVGTSTRNYYHGFRIGTFFGQKNKEK